jgi:hypothetical protein
MAVSLPVPIVIGHHRPTWSAALFPRMGVIRGTPLYFCFPSRPRLPSFPSALAPSTAVDSPSHHSLSLSKQGNKTTVFPSTCSSLFELQPPASDLERKLLPAAAHSAQAHRCHPPPTLLRLPPCKLADADHRPSSSGPADHAARFLDSHSPSST